MRYCVFTLSGEGLPIAQKLEQEGNWVLVAQIQNDEDTTIEGESKSHEDPEQKKRRLGLFNGMVNKMSAEKATEFLLGVPDKENYFVWFDFNYCWKYAEKLKGKGFKGNFPTQEDRRFEVDRDFAKEFVKKNYPYVKVAEVHEFSNKKEAEDFLSDTQELWVLKGKDDNAKTVLPESSDPETAKQEILEALESPDYEKGGFILELKIQDAIEITPEKAYWNGEPIFTNIDIENKKIGAGEIGCMTGCAQDLIIQTDEDSYINEIAFPPIVDEMAKKHEGLFIWDISLLFDRKTGICYMGEFCPNRNGYNAFYSELSMLPRVSDYFESIAKGKNPFDKSTGRFGASVRMFNMTKGDDYLAKKGEPIIVSPESEKMTWLMNAEKQDGNMVDNGYWWQKEYEDVCVVTCYGESLEDAASSAYEILKGVSFSGAFYRPLFDFVSYDYPSSLPNRLEFLVSNKLITIPQGELKRGNKPLVSPYYAKSKAEEKDYDEHYKMKYEREAELLKQDFRGKIRSLSKEIQDTLNNEE